LVDAVPTSGDWLFEVKLDGYRAITAASGDKVRVFTRNGHDWTDRFPGVAEAVAALDLNGALLDGEIVAVDPEGKSDFGLLQQAIKGRHVELSYFVFDLLAESGKDLRSLKLSDRKARLKKLLAHTSRNGPIFYNDHLQKGSDAMLQSLCAKGFEGIIAKRADDAYPKGRGKSWLKIKCEKSQEFVIVGWSPSQRGRSFSSILVGLYEKGELRYAGRVGSGFDTAELGDLAGRFKALERKTPAFKGVVPAAIRKQAHWLEPKLVAHIEFAELTRDKIVRQGRFIALREDKKPREVVLEMPKETANVAKARSKTETGSRDGKIAGIKLTHPDKILFAKQGVTKIDVATYLDKVSSRMLPFLTDRLLSLVRCPAGTGKKCFFQRHAGAGTADEFHRLMIKEKDGGKDEYLYLNSVAGLIAAAQISVLEFHIWGSVVKDIEKPDRIVFDLDPDETVEFAVVRRAALRIRDVLSALGLKSYPLITGGKGIHVVAPIRPRYEWPVVKAFAASLAERLVEDAPDDYVATMSKARRKGRIFIDYFRNERGATAIAPYSPRARDGAPLAWPVSWRDLPKLQTAAEVNMQNFDKWLKKKDAWADYDRGQALKASALKALGIDF
jgi:bifunctional non-homologous end joining protein LigD